MKKFAASAARRKLPRFLFDYIDGGAFTEHTLVVLFGADGVIVSNHGGRQLDGVLSTAKALPKIVDKVSSELTILVDSGIRSGLDVIRMLALGAQAVLLGRPTVYALAVREQAGVEHMLELIRNEMGIVMTLIGANSPADINQSHLCTSS